MASQWVLSLDADYILSDDLVTELRNLDGAAVGYRARFVYCSSRPPVVPRSPGLQGPSLGTARYRMQSPS